MVHGEQIILASVCYLKALNYFDFLKVTREKLSTMGCFTTLGNVCVCFFSSIVLRFSDTML